MAGLWNLPVVFICENNHYGETSQTCHNYLQGPVTWIPRAIFGKLYAPSHQAVYRHCAAVQVWEQPTGVGQRAAHTSLEETTSLA